VLGALLRWPTPETLLRAYATGGVDLHGGSFVELVDALGDRGARRRLGARDYLRLARAALPLVFAREPAAPIDQVFAGDASGRRQAQRNETDFIQFHYDVSNEFYALFLDRNMVYTCAYFKDEADGLERAQEQKIDHVLTKLRLRPGERLLDIGCGWGALAFRAVEKFGARALGVTLSRNQYEYAQEQIRKRGIADRCEVRLQDYRDLRNQDTFDKISGVGVIEHVGRQDMRLYFETVTGLLKDGGLMLNHGISSVDPDSRAVGRGVGDFIGKYVFPNGELAHISLVLREMQAAGLEPTDVESLRRHYARTTAMWAERLEANGSQARALAGEKRLRIWLVYLAGSAFAFAQGWINIYQVLCCKHGGPGLNPLPLTRDYMYR
jgi:cyclopropane-fatty-acyl-phospholipid synthase